MSIQVQIEGANGRIIQDDPSGSLQVIESPHPGRINGTFAAPFRQYFTDDGTATGTSDMQVVASAAAPSLFWISASQQYDRFIKLISIEISDASATLEKFGNITALSNGCKLEWITQEFGTVTFDDALKSNWNFVRMCAGSPAFGDGAGAFRASNVSGTSEGYIPVLDTAHVFGNPWGIPLRKGTTDRIQFTVQDDTTGVDSFNAIGFGTQVIRL